MVFRVLLSLFPASLTRAQNFPEFNITNWINVVLTPIFYLIAHLMWQQLRKDNKVSGGMQAIVILWSFYIILSGMISSFIVTYIPSDNLVTFLIALTVIGVIFVFEYSETWLLTILTATVFTFILINLSGSSTEVLYNELICAILLTGFFFISRYNYSYRANHYLQLVEIRLQNVEIEKASNFKNEVLGMVAHDLRNPIGAVESIALMMEMDDLDADTQENINMIKESCVKARGIIEDLLEVARNENSAGFEMQKTDLNILLRSIVNTWRLPKNIPNNLIFRSTAMPAFADINIEKFQRVIDNLISNAAKFSKEYDTIEVLLSRTNKQFIIEVKDYGLGIPPDILPLIFDRFSKAGRKGLRGEQSTGLGLSIVQQIIEKHKGTIEVSSEVGKGSTFRISLPVAE